MSFHDCILTSYMLNWFAVVENVAAMTSLMVVGELSCQVLSFMNSRSKVAMYDLLCVKGRQVLYTHARVGM